MALLPKYEQLMTAGELASRPDLDPCELVKGRIVHLSPARPFHGTIEALFGAALVSYGRESGRGIVMSGEVGLWVRRDPDTVRGADILFISHERVAARQGSSTFLEVAPELIVEILSPGDRKGEVDEKLRDYFDMGVDLVWIVDPERRSVLAYRSLAEVQRFSEDQILTAEDILPGFSLPLSDLFLN
jgi:Uma2 family endonuclease